MFAPGLHAICVLVTGAALGAGLGTAIGDSGAATIVGASLGAVSSAFPAVAAATAVKRANPYTRDVRGRALLAVDVTWSALNTWAGALFLYVLGVRGNRVEAERSVGSGRIYLARPAISGYATTVGTVVAGCSARLERHESVHVFQARLLGPFYLPLVGVGFVVATVMPYWMVSRRARSAVDSLASYFVAGVYPHTWHEYWAYRSEA